MIGPQRTPPSRLGKKQIIAFLPPALVDAAHVHAKKHDKTIQELIAEAVNQACSQYGRRPIMTLGHSRIVRRTKGRAQVRSHDKAPPCRTGTRSISGWFEEKEVLAANSFANEVGSSVQEFVALGVRQILLEQDGIVIEPETKQPTKAYASAAE